MRERSAGAGRYRRRMRHRRPSSFAVVALLATALVAGCSGGGGGAERDEPGADGTTTTTTTAAAAEIAASTGCGLEPDVATIGPDGPGDVERTFASGGVERIYRLGVPADYDPDVAVPLVLNLHGSGSNALEASVYGDVPRAGTDRGMVVAAPEAIDGRWELGGEGADGTFLTELVDDLTARYCIDLDRIHLIGMSLGAWKAAATACAFGGRFASVALVTVEVFPGTCDPLPVIAFHGTADPVVAYGEGGTVDDAATPNAGLPGTLDNIAAWADNGGCDPDPERSELGDDVTLRRYTGCAEGVGVELYTIDGGGHTWPGSEVIIGPASMTTDTIDATALALDWFEAHPRA